MTSFRMKRPLFSGLAALAVSVTTSSAWADPQDYQFQLVQTEVKVGDGAIVAVRLIDKKSGKAVPDAVIFAKRIDMAPDGMEMMA